MVGLRVQIGTQSVERVPSYLEIFNRTIPVSVGILIMFPNEHFLGLLYLLLTTDLLSLVNFWNNSIHVFDFIMM